ncbi:MAG: hypothetical protein ACREMM_06555 [Gemmatimonadales bacterium]
MRILAPVSALLLFGGCGAMLSHAVAARTATPVPDVFACAREQVKALGYAQTSIDLSEHRLTARRVDEAVRRADVRFRRGLDELEVTVGPLASGETGLTVAASTFSEYATERGFTLQQEGASDAVKAAARVVLERCGQ